MLYEVYILKSIMNLPEPCKDFVKVSHLDILVNPILNTDNLLWISFPCYKKLFFVKSGIMTDIKAILKDTLQVFHIDLKILGWT